MAGVTAQSVSRIYDGKAVVDGVDLDIAAGEFVAILGPSGCGKTTLLRLIAGFEAVDTGQMYFDGDQVSGPGFHLPAEKRRVGMVFQSYALWPHMSVFDNVAYPLRVAKAPAKERKRRVKAALALVGMQDYQDRRPADLSGGQRQRVALARCMAMEPALVLLDEPLANLDVHLRETMQTEFRAFHRDTGATMIYVTHDQAEAMALADRIIVMDKGVVQQVATPRMLYDCPATTMVAGFIGQGMVVSATALAPDDQGYCRVGIFGCETRIRAGTTVPGAVQVCLRSETLGMLQNDTQGFDAVILDRIFRGNVTSLVIRPDAAPDQLLRMNLAGPCPDVGAAIRLSVNDAWVIPGG